ncbi:MAG: hypothetical protein U9R75_00495 [Candidatus Thermoplasmatota archaeon]|nr:hypothetical protein [Candidatus Thermoplasmatota archaeon]
MSDLWSTIKAIVLLISGISAVAWVVLKVGYKLWMSRKHHVGYWDIDIPAWYEGLFWPIMLFLVVANILFYLT